MRLIGYGGMLTESFVAIMALITAAILNQHLYFRDDQRPVGGHRDRAKPRPEYVNGLCLSGPPITAPRSPRPPTSARSRSSRAPAGAHPGVRDASEVLHQVFGGQPRRSGKTSRSCSRRCSS